MATTTTNLGLTKQAPGEHASLVALNGNFDLIDDFAGVAKEVVGSSKAAIFNANANNYTTTGIYFFATGTMNVPGDYGQLVVLAASSVNIVMQLYSLSRKLYYREFRESTWGSWKELAINGERINGWYADHESKTTYSMPLDGLTTGAYWMSQMYIQTGIGSCGVYIVFMDTSFNVEVTKVSGNSAITFTGVKNGDYITLTASDTVWGGIRATTMN